ncbi:DUF1338 domain-containing protein [Sphingobacterium alkalisoli]|uniref:2-oxoadipate dioxygenase/decarboxylase n=1 Tax=Sphingobacterium alkalisoli TaxID=1874115 RepID=A0A4U0H8Y3_9SPHI|nr:DUF1338 domain-containing protein [Sphingobacterium alkalisoli]TJY68236.1 DUF1338 domain-containing protein [Sphingobacterium alkalisoli]GGH08009.1 DUF1338 domain-containing protein [Sphingobacterium alkalisoli]
MHFDENNPLDIVLNDLFEHYRQNVADVDKITKSLLDKGVVASQNDIVNDHIAFRTLAVPYLGIQSFEKIFLKYGYKKRDYYYFEGKKLDAYWYSPPANHYPRIFVSELRVADLSQNAQAIIYGYTKNVDSDPVDELQLSNGKEVANFLQRPLWALPTSKDYQALLAESEYAAWVIYNRYYLNHYTISIHELKEGYNTLEEFNRFLADIGVKLNTSGGVIKTSDDGLLRQSSTVSALYEAKFADNKSLEIAGSYVEFAERSILPEYKDMPKDQIQPQHRRDGFETNNADKIFESTYTAQIKGS